MGIGQSVIVLRLTGGEFLGVRSTGERPYNKGYTWVYKITENYESQIII